MRPKSGTRKATSEQVVKDIRRATRKQYSAEEKIRIVLDGLRGEDSQGGCFPPKAIVGLNRPAAIVNNGNLNRLISWEKFSPTSNLAVGLLD